MTMEVALAIFLGAFASHDGMHRYGLFTFRM
jgi:hypothetical protein